MLKRPFHLGSLELPSNVFCSPLAGCSDFPFRQMTAAYHPGLIYCEMVKMDALVRNDAHSFRMLDYNKEMHPIGAQLCGSKVEIAAEAARMVEELGFDALDFNCGCPVDKVTKDGSGSALLKTPQLIGEILSKMIAAVSIPVTVKVRMGWDEESINIEEVTKIAEAAGAEIIFVHGRTRKQGYSGTVNYEAIRRSKQVADRIKVFGNGDITDPLSAQTMFEQTGCDGILLARGTFGNPWLIEQIYRHFENRPPLQMTPDLFKETFMKHFNYVSTYQSERRALLDMRRIGCWFLKGRKGGKELRIKLTKLSSMEELVSLFAAFPWEDLIY